MALRIPRPLHSAVLFVLRPAESAVRRLIVIAARGLVAKPSPSRPVSPGLVGRGRSNRPSFPLFDPRKRFAPRRRKPGPGPRIRVLGDDPLIPAFLRWTPPAAPAPPPDDGLSDASRLCSRLEAVRLALDDLPRQARRLARLRARREKVPELRFKLPLRPGRPPGHRKRQVHAIDPVLADCHALARDVLAHDTS